jgi:LmbE family N-acetylglucosaminyl deacetylase
MSSATRRNVIKSAGAGMATMFMGAEVLDPRQVLGQPTSKDSARTNDAPSNVMAIAGHAGDAFFAMGAPVAVATHSGGQGSLLSLSLGEKGSSVIPPARYGKMLRSAAQKAAALIGANALFLHYPDGEVPVNNEAAFAVCDFIRQYKPETIVTHWKGSWHKDHRACYDIVQDAVFYAGVSGFVRDYPAHEVSSLFFADNWEDATGFVPDTYLDITPVCDRWLAACSAFPMWRGETGFRYNDYYASRAVACGCLSHFDRAVCLMSPEGQQVQHTRAL